jgi:hypothetical protein
MTNLNNAIADGDLDQVSGGLDCKSAMTVASVYNLTAQVLGALGDSAGSAVFSGRSQGILQGACPA